MNSSTPVNHFTLKPSDLSAIRLLAKNKEPKYTNHATEQTLVRDIFHSEVREVLSSSTNQIVEIQSKSNTPGQKHTHPRALIYDPKYQKSFRFLYKGIIIKHNKTEPTYTKTSLFLCEKRRFFMARTEKGVVTTI